MNNTKLQARFRVIRQNDRSFSNLKNYRRDIEAYEECIQHFIDNGCDSTAVIERWLKKIEALKLKKATYEQVLKRQLDDLDRDFALSFAVISLSAWQKKVL